MRKTYVFQIQIRTFRDFLNYLKFTYRFAFYGIIRTGKQAFKSYETGKLLFHMPLNEASLSVRFLTPEEHAEMTDYLVSHNLLRRGSILSAEGIPAQEW